MIGRSSWRFFRRVMRARTFMLHSMPVPVMIPSLMAACGSPKNTSASSAKTGRYTRLPWPASFWSKSATISTRIRRFVALGRHRRDRADIGVEWQRDAAAEPSAAVAHLRRHRHRLWELVAQHPEIPQDSALAGPERGQLNE